MLLPHEDDVPRVEGGRPPDAQVGAVLAAEVLDPVVPLLEPDGGVAAGHPVVALEVVGPVGPAEDVLLGTEAERQAAEGKARIKSALMPPETLLTEVAQ